MSDFLASLTVGDVPVPALPDAADVSVPFTGSGPAYAVLANAAGAAAQVRAAWGTVESKYDAMLAANPSPDGPHDRMVLLTRMRQYLRTGDETREAGAAAVTEFSVLSLRAVRWRFSQQGLRWSVTLELGAGNAARLTWEMENDPGGEALFFLRPDVEHRSFHAVTDAAECQTFPGAVTAEDGAFTFARESSLPLRMEMRGAEFRCEPEWQHALWLPVEAERGLPDRTDLFSPGVFVWKPSAIERGVCTVVAGAGVPVFSEGEFFGDGPQPLPQVMARALDLFLARRDGEWTVIAGYPWFLDWGRDSLIFTRGLIAGGRPDEAASILRRFAAWEHGGSIPNLLRGRDASDRETSDAPLWLVLAVRDLVAVRPAVLEQMAGTRTLRRVVCDLVAAHIKGAAHGVSFDPGSGLLWSPSHYTWMDTARPAGTPREGYPVSIQCLWAAALEFAHTLDDSRGWQGLAARVRDSIQKYYWREHDGYLADCLHGPRGTPAAQATADDHLRPNQLLAVTLGAVTSVPHMQRIVASCQVLLVPGALRTLAPRRVEFPLAVEWDGVPQHDPHFPYHGRYTGPDNGPRKAAYHNGTAWPWLLPSYAEALVMAHGPDAVPAARRLLGTTAELMRDACPGQVPEIVDGDAPHRPRGCGAQAWSVSEWVRVWRQLG